MIMVIAYREQESAKGYAKLHIETLEVASMEQGEKVFEFVKDRVKSTSNGKIVYRRYVTKNGKVYD